jgi:erythromycin esterase
LTATRTTTLGIAATAIVALAALLQLAPASAHPPGCSPVSRWVEHHAVPVPHDTSRPGPDLAAISHATAGARVIGLGEPGHTISEVTTLQDRYVRHLVTHDGVRAIAFEMDWTLGLGVDAYVLGQRDDLDAVLGTLEGIWRTAEFRDVLEWLRSYNDTHRKDVRIAGAEYFATGLAAYDAVETYVATHAPDRLPEVQTHFELLRPDSDDIGAHLWEYLEVENKAPYVAAAAAVQRIVASAVGGEHGLALQHARQIAWWYEGFSLQWDDIPHYRDAKAAENVRWWQQHTGARTVYWAASAHVADAGQLTITEPGQTDTTFASAGSHLEDWYGASYVPIGFTFDRGTYRTGEGETIDLPPAPEGWFEEPLGDVRRERFVLALDRPVPPAVREWLHAPLVTRGLPEYGDASTASGGTLAEWFDVSPSTPL